MDELRQFLTNLQINADEMLQSGSTQGPQGIFDNNTIQQINLRLGLSRWNIVDNSVKVDAVPVPHPKLPQQASSQQQAQQQATAQNQSQQRRTAPQNQSRSYDTVPQTNQTSPQATTNSQNQASNNVSEQTVSRKTCGFVHAIRATLQDNDFVMCKTIANKKSYGFAGQYRAGQKIQFTISAAATSNCDVLVGFTTCRPQHFMSDTETDEVFKHPETIQIDADCVCSITIWVENKHMVISQRGDLTKSISLPQQALFPMVICTQPCWVTIDISGTTETTQQSNSNTNNTNISSAITNQCVICINASYEYMAYPCRHLCVCESCKNRLQELGDRSCPVCRQQFTELMKIHLC